MKKRYDLAVVGGGFSGCAAAISAARCGLRVLLAEQGNSLGGSAVNCLVNPFMPYWTQKDGKKLVLSEGLFAEICGEMKKISPLAIDGITFNEEYLKIVLNRMTTEAGVELLFHSMLTGASAEKGRVTSIELRNKSGRLDIYADYFVDATGDADLSVLAGFPVRKGRKGDGLCQPMTLCFRIADVDCEAYAREYSQINERYQKFRKEGKIRNPREDILTFRMLVGGVVHFNSTRIVKRDPTDAFDLTRAELEAREQLFELYTFLRDNTEAFRNSTLLTSASSIGVRESRMIDGEYLLTGKELVDCVKFEDSIALGNYDIDIHNPEGTGTSHYYFPEGQYYTIPYRALIPKNSENLLVAGRCISVDHEAQASIRIMPTVCCLGEAAGCAAGLAASAGCSVRDVDVDRLHGLLARNNARF